MNFRKGKCENHILSKYEEISPKEVMFTGFMDFVLLTKYNDGKEANTLNVMSTKDDDIESNVKGRSGYREK